MAQLYNELQERTSCCKRMLANEMPNFGFASVCMVAGRTERGTLALP